ncbi:hypothetical protein EJB05_53100, partial [Eragrostis curvula]
MRRSGERDPHAAAARIIGCRVHGAFEPSRDASRPIAPRVSGAESSLGPVAASIEHARSDRVPDHVTWPRENINASRHGSPRGSRAGGGDGEAAGADPDAVAQSYWHVHAQDKSAWTQEMDIRSPSFM